MKQLRMFALCALASLSACTTLERSAHVFSPAAPSPLNFSYPGSGSALYYQFSTEVKDPVDTLVFIFGGSGCPSWKSVMPDYLKGLSVNA